MVTNYREQIDIAAYKIVRAMIDSGFVESEPEGIDWEGEIAKIIREKFGIE